MSAKLWWVVRREYLERVRSKAFVVATVLVPLLMWGMMAGPVLLAKRGGKPLRVTVLDASGSLREPVEEALRQARFEDTRRFEVVPAEPGSADDAETAARARTVAGQLDGYLVLPQDAIAGATATYFGRTVTNRIDLRTMERALADVVVSQRLSRSGLDPQRVRDMMRGPELRTVQLSSRGAREDRGGMMLLSIVLMMLLYLGIQMWGQAVMTGVIEEKGSRVLEVLASATPASTLLAGKLLGIGAAGLTQVGVWAASLAAVSATGGTLAAGPFGMPEVNPLVIGAFVLYFVLGFFLYAALFAAVGAAVNTVQEAQSLAFPVFMPLIAAMVFFPLILESPDSRLSVALSLLPLVSPLLMFLRIVVLTPPLWQIALSLVLLLASIWAVVWFSARIYRVGILMYGKKPTLAEMLRWVKHT